MPPGEGKTGAGVVEGAFFRSRSPVDRAVTGRAAGAEALAVGIFVAGHTAALEPLKTVQSRDGRRRFVLSRLMTAHTGDLSVFVAQLERQQRVEPQPGALARSAPGLLAVATLASLAAAVVGGGIGVAVGTGLK